MFASLFLRDIGLCLFSYGVLVSFLVSGDSGLRLNFLKRFFISVLPSHHVILKLLESDTQLPSPNISLGMLASDFTLAGSILLLAKSE